MVAEVVGKVMVVPSVPASVRELLIAATFPEATLTPRYSTAQFVGAVGVADNAVKMAVPPTGIVHANEPLEELTVIDEVELRL